jgi:hypothetical protein
MNYEQGNDSHLSVPRSSFKVQLLARCDLARDKARSRAKSLSWQTQGGRVEYPQGWAGEKVAFLSILYGVLLLFEMY